ncbi:MULTISPECIES: hypothetical protein [unclassified Burkholderia]|uniref:hypothetical protein n=1 Tax=unclassified Burkholderia TaxID=2613784 RepID=UPI0012E371FF|nr:MULTISPECIES: hypothetical protein [unclassified Burkholderia]
MVASSRRDGGCPVPIVSRRAADCLERGLNHSERENRPTGGMGIGFTKMPRVIFSGTLTQFIRFATANDGLPKRSWNNRVLLPEKNSSVNHYFAYRRCCRTP